MAPAALALRCLSLHHLILNPNSLVYLEIFQGCFPSLFQDLNENHLILPAPGQRSPRHLPQAAAQQRARRQHGGLRLRTRQQGQPVHDPGRTGGTHNTHPCGTGEALPEAALAPLLPGCSACAAGGGWPVQGCVAVSAAVWYTCQLTLCDADSCACLPPATPRRRSLPMIAMATKRTAAQQCPTGSERLGQLYQQRQELPAPPCLSHSQNTRQADAFRTDRQSS